MSIKELGNTMDLLDLHSKMLRNIFLNVELLLNDGISNISEYDLQAFMFLYFRRAVINIDGISAEREKEGKVDCVLLKNGLPIVFYELKTYFKKNEKLKSKDFDHDIQKIADKLKECPGAKGFIVTSGLKNKFSLTALDKFTWLKERLHDNKRNWVKYLLPSKQWVQLRPSQFQTFGRSLAMTWEVKL